MVWREATQKRSRRSRSTDGADGYAGLRPSDETVTRQGNAGADGVFHKERGPANENGYGGRYRK
jgi:hypothetical protein